MAAETIAASGAHVEVYERMPSAGRKLLMAGKGGLNITHTEAIEAFVGRYGNRRNELEILLRGFDADALRAWVHGLGITTFVGTSGRVFPKAMKAAPLLRAWLHRLRGTGVKLHMRHEWAGWDVEGALRFETPHGERTVDPDATVLALGGGSWPQLGSDASWVSILRERGLDVASLSAANCGFDVDWSVHFRERFNGEPVKSVTLTLADDPRPAHAIPGEFIITAHGVEGGAIYAMSRAIRDRIEAHGSATVEVDLTPGWNVERLRGALETPRGSRSLSSHVQSRTGIRGVKMGLIREALTPDAIADPQRLASAIKALPLELIRPRPLAEAISSAGGVRFDRLDERLMVRSLPGVFCAGEMLDWEAPTGGYLLTACFATGRAAGNGVLAWLARER